jgi:hypothetical protein
MRAPVQSVVHLGGRPRADSEDEFDFDSNPKDIAAGATRIAATFIRAQAGPDVTAKILNASGQVVATQNAECTFR